MTGRFVASHSQHPDPIDAVGEVLGDLSERMQGNSDLAVVFASGTHAAALSHITASVSQFMGAQTVLGVSVSGVIGGGEEIESGSAVSVWLGETGPVRPIRLEAIDGGRTILGLPEEIPDEAVLLLLADPFSFPAELLLDALAQSAPAVHVVGGLASAARAPGGNTLILDGAVHTGGAVGVLLQPGVSTPLVSQGCRPIGTPWVVTDGAGQLIGALGGEPALVRLEAVIQGLSDADRALAARGLHLGIVANEQTESFQRGDFLIRSVLGGDRSTGALAVGDRVQVGQVVQFHVRDAVSASEDLDHQLAEHDRDPVQGALVFTCTGRGSHMFAEPSHDAWAVRERFGEVATAGMFCAGELGPVGPRNALHGFTATMLLF
ncbi:MAG: hypothetical protein HKN03_13865 [Acidimicrobiales bacterium]|nr:hypothetical protein [Acidimicrobiales bacterium]